MKILFLGPQNSRVIKILIDNGHKVAAYEGKLKPEWFEDNNYECIISYNYRYIITPNLLSLVNYKAINLHISYLPYNRGAHPNYWSWVDNTPKGVTIHYIDDGLDTGNTILRRLVQLDSNDTLRKTHKQLNDELVWLFESNLEYILNFPKGVSQAGPSTFHRSSDLPVLPKGWDTLCREVIK